MPCVFTNAEIFFISALSAEMKKIFSSANSVARTNLPEADKAGGEKNALIKLQSKAGTICVFQPKLYFFAISLRMGNK